MSIQLPVPVENTRQPILTPDRKAAFLEKLAVFGNVRLSCKAACVSPQTAYRARRQSPAFAKAWDAALLAARTHTEQELADRAIHGVEEAVYYHGEEVARRRRFDARLLLAHLAQLDRLAEREDLAEALPLLDDQIEALRRGEELPEEEEPPRTIAKQAEGGCGERNDGSGNLPQDSVPSVPSDRAAQEQAEDQPEDIEEALEDWPGAELGPHDEMWLGNRLERMEAARPVGVLRPHQLANARLDAGDIEVLQLEAFEAGAEEWWLVGSDLGAKPGTGPGVGLPSGKGGETPR